jgi:hypothetical protein
MEERGDIRGIDCIIPAIRKYIFTNLLYWLNTASGRKVM